MTDRPQLPDPSEWRIEQTRDGEWLPVRIADDATPFDPFPTHDDAVRAVEEHTTA